MPSSISAFITVSTESAMISRLTSEKCIPSWPMLMPSETEIVPNCSGNPTGRVHTLLGGLRQPVQRQVAGGDLVPTRGHTDLRLVEVLVAHPHRAQHAARGARSRPSVTTELRGFMSAMPAAYPPWAAT
jgi:hypothetical protein